MKNISLKKLIRFSLALILLSALSSILFNFIMSGGIPRYESVEIDSLATDVNSEQAYWLYRNDKAVFIDARDKEEFDLFHIDGAVSLPYKSSREYKHETMKSLMPDQRLVVYCSDNDCTVAERLIGQLKYMGFNHVLLYRDGLSAWKQNKYPVKGFDKDE
ncbi:MAG: rhodanese-like domain-containing protein [Calditrichaceae bacterium]|nr:rhodanese-like domain-containing protein [Calditrichaceae bacterium]MBN2708743.1 rhodanese-like domain-containing protein [Calditrichaceae bacterium]RQV97110.1 MAG: rhodanese-like domain-containing protein [Calditrichota bacterium]